MATLHLVKKIFRSQDVPQENKRGRNEGDPKQTIFRPDGGESQAFSARRAECSLIYTASQQRVRTGGVSGDGGLKTWRHLFESAVSSVWSSACFLFRLRRGFFERLAALAEARDPKEGGT